MASISVRRSASSRPSARVPVDALSVQKTGRPTRASAADQGVHQHMLLHTSATSQSKAPRCTSASGMVEMTASGSDGLVWHADTVGGPEIATYSVAAVVAAAGLAAAFRAAFFLTAGLVFFANAFLAAHLFFNAATIFALPSSLNRCLGFEDSAGFDSDSPRILAHLACCPAAILRLAAADTVRLRAGAPGAVTAPEAPPDSVARSSAICVSMCRFCSSNPRIAAVMISSVSLVGMRMNAPLGHSTPLELCNRNAAPNFPFGATPS